MIDLLTKNPTDIQGNRKKIEKEILNYFNTENLQEAFEKANIKVDVVGFFAGAGKRWINSLNGYTCFDKEKPRCLGPVKNILKNNGSKVPIGIYSLGILSNIGRNIIIYTSHREEIKQEILQPLNQEAEFFKQKIIEGKEKVSGHGDAIRQVKDLISNEYMLTYFSGIPCSRKTALMSLLFMEILKRKGYEIPLLLPVTYTDNRKYEIVLDEKNRPYKVLHEKLKGDKINSGFGFTNTGMRVYRTESLLRAINVFEEILEKNNSYSSLNPNLNDEFALDHIDEELMKDKTPRIFPVCPHYEFTLVKSADEIPEFLKAIKKVIEEDKILS